MCWLADIYNYQWKYSEKREKLTFSNMTLEWGRVVAWRRLLLYTNGALLSEYMHASFIANLLCFKVCQARHSLSLTQITDDFCRPWDLIKRKKAHFHCLMLQCCRIEEKECLNLKFMPQQSLEGRKVHMNQMARWTRLVKMYQFLSQQHIRAWHG